MSNIQFQTPKADIENLNIRKKGKENERISIIDVTMECQVKEEILKSLVMSDKVPDLWDKNGDKRFHGVSSINCIARFENHTIKIGELMFEDVELKSFSFQPIPQRMAILRFTVTLFKPTEHQTGVLIDLYKESMAIDVTGSPQNDIEDT